MLKTPASSRTASTPLSGVGDEAITLTLQEAPDRAKARYLAARQGSVVVAIGDEELVLDPSAPPDNSAPLVLAQDEKLAKLKDWLATLR